MRGLKQLTSGRALECRRLAQGRLQRPDLGTKTSGRVTVVRQAIVEVLKPVARTRSTQAVCQSFSVAYRLRLPLLYKQCSPGAQSTVSS